MDRSHILQSAFILTDSLKEWLITKKYFFDVQEQIDEFSDYHKAKGSRFVDWDAAFRNWVRTGIKMGTIKLEARKEYHQDIEPEFIKAPKELTEMINKLSEKMRME